MRAEEHQVGRENLEHITVAEQCGQDRWSLPGTNPELPAPVRSGSLSVVFAGFGFGEVGVESDRDGQPVFPCEVEAQDRPVRHRVLAEEGGARLRVFVQYQADPENAQRPGLVYRLASLVLVLVTGVRHAGGMPSGKDALAIFHSSSMNGP